MYQKSLVLLNMERLDIYTQDFRKTGKTFIRGEKLHTGEYYYGIHIWIYNKHGQFLIQKRNKPFNGFESIWLCTMGAVVSGEDGQRGAIRETREELGIALPESSLKMVSRTLEKDLFFREIYFAQWDGSLTELVLDPTEVKDARWAFFHEIEKMIFDNLFYDFGSPYNQLIKSELQKRGIKVL